MIEILNFRLLPGTDEEAFLDIDHRLQVEFAYQQPGLMRRTTAKSEDGQWIVVDLWRSPADADACAQLWEHDPAVKKFMALVDPKTVTTARYFERD